MKALLAILCLFACGASARASSSFEIDSPYERQQVTADRTVYHSRERVYEAFGHVVVSSSGRRLSCDYLWVDDKTKELKARGNVVFIDKDTTIEAAELHFNLETGFGSIFYGRVSNDLYSLKGQLIRRVSEDRFLTTDGEYTTCRDCAESWKIAARNVDLTIDGYAFMNGVFIKIKDIPTLFLPYLVVPVKTKRQSGFLFPRIGGGTHGFGAVLPFYWAISEHQDATFGFGRYGDRGLRYEFEHRYRSYNGIHGQLNFYRTNDRNFSYGNHRTAFRSENEWPFFRHFGMRWRAYEVFDRDYPLDFPEDIRGAWMPTLESNAVATAPFNNFFLSVEGRRYRNLLYEQPVGFDGGTVQAVPSVYFGVAERTVAGPLLASFYGRFDRFRRHNGSFYDVDMNRNAFGQLVYDEGRDTIREADRLILQPEIAMPFRLGSFLSLNPSVQFNEIRYSFSVPTATGEVPNTSTRYLLAKLEASTVIERVYDYDGINVSRLKHQISPFLTFSNIPWIAQGAKSHPFNDGKFGQIWRDGGIFDQYDMVPITNETNFLRYPQGKSLYYGFTSRLIRRIRNREELQPKAYPYDLVKQKPKEYPKPLNRKMELQIERDRLFDEVAPQYDQYQEVWLVNVSQAYDFKTAQKFRDDPKRAFSFLQAKSDVTLDRFSHSLEYRFYPRLPVRALDSSGNPIVDKVYSNQQFVSTAFTWYLENLSNLRRTRTFVRSLSATFTKGAQPAPSRTVGTTINWSVNDFVGLKFAYNYDLFTRSQVNWSAQTTFTHSSECWGVLLRYDWLRTREPQRSEVGFELLLNLMGTGFFGTDQASQGGIFGGI